MAIEMRFVYIEKDKYGVKLKFPKRKCKECQKYPCFKGIEICLSNFAAYGCTHYKEPKLNE